MLILTHRTMRRCFKTSGFCSNMKNLIPPSWPRENVFEDSAETLLPLKLFLTMVHPRNSSEAILAFAHPQNLCP